MVWLWHQACPQYVGLRTYMNAVSPLGENLVHHTSALLVVPTVTVDLVGHVVVRVVVGGRPLDTDLADGAVELPRVEDVAQHRVVVAVEVVELIHRVLDGAAVLVVEPARVERRVVVLYRAAEQ